MINRGEAFPMYSFANILDTRATKSHIEEFDFLWTEPSGYGTKAQTGIKKAASGAAGLVVIQPAGTYSFCSDAYSVDNLDAHVGFNFYGDVYAPDYPSLVTRREWATTDQVCFPSLCLVVIMKLI